MSRITTSFIIRTYNESKWLSKVLTSLARQTRKDFEIIVVDSGSNDATLKIAQSSPYITKIIQIKKKHFNYAYSANLGAALAQGIYLGYLSGHSVPCTCSWYEDGIKNFDDQKVGAISGYHLCLPDASEEEKKRDLKMGKAYFTRDNDALWISNTNSLIRKKLWYEYPFDERITAGTEQYKFATEGGEDFDLCQELRSRGWICIIDPKFNVFHSHGGLRRKTHIELRDKWKKICKMIDMKKRPSNSYSVIFGGEVKVGGSILTRLLNFLDE